MNKQTAVQTTDVPGHVIFKARLIEYRIPTDNDLEDKMNVFQQSTCLLGPWSETGAI